MRATSAVLAFGLLCACSRTPEPDPEPAPIATPAIIPSVTPPPLHAAPVPPPPASLTHVTIKAIGMNCPESCPISVRSALASVPGIYEIGFDLDHESVFVSYDSSLGPPKEFAKPMIAAIKSVGFDPWLARESWPPDAQAQVHVVATAP
jgi:copper chaperone CopZ